MISQDLRVHVVEKYFFPRRNFVDERLENIFYRRLWWIIIFDHLLWTDDDDYKFFSKKTFSL